MTFDPILADIRFGCGLSPSITPPQSVAAMLDPLLNTDWVASRYPISRYQEYQGFIRTRRDLRLVLKKAVGSEAQDAAAEEIDRVQKTANRAVTEDMRQVFLRRARTDSGFRERLVFFWADHFTALGKGALFRFATASYVESAIRPNITATFSDLMFDAVTHPVMLNYLDQAQSVGPGSASAQKKSRDVGLNENLAREVLELHTLGVDGPYSQADVRQLAELFTGLGVGKSGEFVFRAQRAEPGDETVLGRRYSGDNAALGDIREVLHDLATHPTTAHHIATKLARHFVGDHPSDALIMAIEARFNETGGDLISVYDAMLSHPDAWHRGGGNLKQPVAFIGSTLRALNCGDRDLGALNRRKLQTVLDIPLRTMGQRWQSPLGPDGWAEDDSHWATPQGQAARLQWALMAPLVLRRSLPDPRDFVVSALGHDVPDAVRFAANAAETRREGIALVLTSPAFQRH